MFVLQETENMGGERREVVAPLLMHRAPRSCHRARRQQGSGTREAASAIAGQAREERRVRGGRWWYLMVE